MRTVGFSNRPWRARERFLGDTSEEAFKDWCNVVGLKWADYGLRRPDLDVSALPLKIRYTPDFIGGDQLYEVMAVGRDHLLKLKVEKYLALGQWNQEAPTHLWVWNWPMKSGGALPIPSLADVVIGAPDLRSFRDGKHYWSIKVQDLDISWLRLDDSAA
jgi:hypothetical protein